MKIILLLLFPLILQTQIGPENDMMDMEYGMDMITWIKSLSKSNLMEDFDAKQARAIVEDLRQNELLHVLKAIMIYAKDEKTVLFVYKGLKEETIEQLREKGFTVEDAQDWHGIPTDHKYKIYW